MVQASTRIQHVMASWINNPVWRLVLIWRARSINFKEEDLKKRQRLGLMMLLDQCKWIRCAGGQQQQLATPNLLLLASNSRSMQLAILDPFALIQQHHKPQPTACHSALVAYAMPLSHCRVFCE